MRFLCIILPMCKSIKRLFLRLLVVILALNTFQFSFAADLDGGSPENSCHEIQLHTVIATEDVITDPCNSEHKVHCFSLLGCTSSLNSSSILPGISYLEPARASIKLGHKKNDSALVTNYPKLLERPPIVQVFLLPG
jgi:hypothetical protein